MVKPRMKQKSKRQSCSLKYRIRKNVANHNKKLKKQAKKNAAAGKVKQNRKDPGIPNSAPFKEEVLREAQIKKEQEEVDRQRRRLEQRRQAQNKKTLSLQDIQENALKAQKAFNDKETMMEKLSKSHSLQSLLSSETSRKAYYKEFRKVVESADVVIEVLDARDPLGCRCRDVENAILDASPTKKIILLLNKIDLVPKQNVEEWLKFLRNDYPTVAFKSSTQTQKDRLTQMKVPVKHITSEILANTAQCVGADNLLKLLSNYCRHDDIQSSIVVGVVGYPNVGKSSVINSLKRAKACGVGSTPGFTKSVKEVVITKNIKILDSPGIVMATGTDEAAVVLRNCVKVETLDDPVTPVEAIIRRCDRNQLMMKYNIGSFETTTEFLQLMAKRFGKLRKGGHPNIKAAAKGVLKDWNSGKITYYTRPPVMKNTHVGAKIVSTMSEEFDWDSLEQANQSALEAVKESCPSASHLVVLSEAVEAGQLMETNEKNNVKVEMPAEDDDEEMMDMDDEAKLGKIEVDLTVKKSKKEAGKGAKSVKFNSANPFASVVTKGSNIQANKQMKDALKMKKKQRKRADKIGDKLGDSLMSAMSSMGSSQKQTEDYDFDVDMQL